MTSCYFNIDRAFEENLGVFYCRINGKTERVFSDEKTVGFSFNKETICYLTHMGEMIPVSVEKMVEALNEFFHKGFVSVS